MASSRNVSTTPQIPETAEDRVLQHLRNLDERALHTKLVVPLFTAMGFEHVVYVHGPAERGKDVIYVARDHFGDPRLEVCQVKNTPFSGNAASRESTVAVYTQLTQCRFYEALNPETNRKERPQGVVLLTTFALSDAALADASPLLEESRQAQIKIIGPDKLIRLIREYLPDYFAEIAFPGSALSSRLRSFVDRHHEYAAFDSRECRTISDIFVNLDVSPLGRTLLAFSRRRLGINIDNIKKRLPIPKVTRDKLIGMQSALLPDLQKPHILVRDVRDGTESISPGNDDEQTPTVHPSGVLPFVRQIERIVKELTGIDPSSGGGKTLPALLSTLSDCSELLDELALTDLWKRLVVDLRRQEMSGDTTATSENIVVPTFDVSVPDVDPASLLEISNDLCVIGEAGAGKTSFARSLARKALDAGIKVIYFPCNRLQDVDSSLKVAVRDFLREVCDQRRIGDVDAWLREVELLILDGCDEAATFGGRLVRDIEDFAKPTGAKLSVRRQVSIDVPKDLEPKIGITTLADGEVRISIRERLTSIDVRRLKDAFQLGNATDEWSSLMKTYIARCPRIVITTRAEALLDLKPRFLTMRLKPFTDAQMLEFFRRWFAASGRDFNPVLSFLQTNPHVKDVCRTPIMASIVAALYENDFDLPKSRTDIYVKRFDLLLNRWDHVKNVRKRNRVGPSDKERLLAVIAHKMHSCHSRVFTINDFADVWNQGFNTAYPSLSAAEVIEELRQQNNVVISEGGNDYSLGHLSFQEFLTARAILLQQQLAFLVQHFGDPWWRQVAIFYVGLTGDASALLKAAQENFSLSGDREFLEQLANESRYTPAHVRRFVLDCADDDDYSSGNELDEENYDIALEDDDGGEDY